MLKKIYQADFLLLPEHEFWNMFILLRKEKDFFYECAGRSTEKPPDANGFFDYEHAFFTLDGDVLSLNKRMRPSLIAFLWKSEIGIDVVIQVVLEFVVIFSTRLHRLCLLLLSDLYLSL